MTAADEARAEAAQRWPLPEFAPWEELLFSQRDVDSKSSQAFVAGAEWQASRDSAELTRLYAINEELAGQVQAAQATIAAALGYFGDGETAYIAKVLRRADTSALDAAILAAKAEGGERGRNETIADHRPPLTGFDKRVNPYPVTPTGNGENTHE